MSRRATSHARTPVPITLSEEGGVRYLHFGSPWVQGAMRIARPDELVLDYVRQMMGWLLFLESPARILQLGLGAGSLTRFSLRHCLDSEITAVDVSDEVIETARQWFALPQEDPRLRVVRADALEFVERAASRGRYGVIQVDLYDMHARGPAIESQRFYRACREALAEPGICVVNLFGRHASYERSLHRIERAFEGRVLALPAIAQGNRVAFAFAGPTLQVRWTLLQARARMLRGRMGLLGEDLVRELRARSGSGANLVV